MRGLIVFILALLIMGQQPDPEFSQEASDGQQAQEESTETDTQDAFPITEVDLEEQAYFDSLETLAQLVEAEAGNQSLCGKRLVARVVLNRVESEQFPDDIESVIFQENQFAVIKDGAFDRAIPSEESYEAVRLELAECSDPYVLYFTADGYGQYGTPAYQVGDHYFSY